MKKIDKNEIYKKWEESGMLDDFKKQGRKYLSGNYPVMTAIDKVRLIKYFMIKNLKKRKYQR